MNHTPQKRFAIIGILGGIICLSFAILYFWDDTFASVNPELENSSTTTNSPDLVESKEYQAIVTAVIQSTGDYWRGLLFENNRKYENPEVVFYAASKPPACKEKKQFVQSFYCQKEKTIYLEESFFQRLYKDFSPQKREMTGAYIIAHQVGVHVQNLLRITHKSKRLQNKKPSLTESLQAREDIQADCLAGMWGHAIQETGIFSDGEIAQAMNTLLELEDPDSFDPDRVQDRLNWFNVGYEHGEFKKCNTFKKREKPRIKSIR